MTAAERSSRARSGLRRRGWEGSEPVSGRGETALLRSLVELAGDRSGEDVVVGPGDDAAAWHPRGTALVSCDSLVEGVDFRRAHQTPYQVGWKAWRGAVSDLAAMGGRARLGLASALLPATTSAHAVEAVQLGLVEAAAEDGARILGGDLSRTDGPLALSVTVIGEAGRGGPVTLGGGRPGDLLLVTGSLGEAAAGLRALEEPGRPPLPAWLARLNLPPSRLAEGQLLGGLGARAMTDVSDGLVLDAGRLCQASGLGAELWLERLPLGRGLAPDRDGLRLALSGGEDFELLAALPEAELERLQARWRPGLAPLAVVGRLRAEAGLELLSRPGGERITLPEAHGFRHF